jgi:MOSC domain-containing protein YiiM
MVVESVNVSQLITRPRGDGVISTGIFKKPVSGPVAVRPLGLEGDAQGDLRHHGGPHKAVYAYTIEHIEAWRHELGRFDVGPGSMGENLTTRGLNEADVCIGDRFAIGSCVLEVSEPRTPCSTLAMAMDDKGFPKVFLASGRTGFYLRVVTPGALAAGDRIGRVERAEHGPRIPVGEVSRLMHLAADDLAGARRCLQVETLGPTWRERFAKRVG